MTCRTVCNQSNATGATSGAGTVNPSVAPEFTPVLVGFVLFDLKFCRSLFVPLLFFFYLLCCLSFDLRILITPLVSSNCSHNIFYQF